MYHPYVIDCFPLWQRFYAIRSGAIFMYSVLKMEVGPRPTVRGI